ncbi:NAD-dependent epimerase/dehydratase family protein [Kitasatospora sp. NPDC004799]|uniref:NAD-dependent epimerase/dehydratase family protein n=1 Tax=Kitasatospora sp. NPDC004799 TaxID=3154460 RepID=UPI00339EC99F
MRRLLVLGGSAFVGRAVVESARSRGWAVTTFNWDRTGPLDPADADGGPTVERLTGDRTRAEDLQVLRGREWDQVVDTWQGPAAAVRATAGLLADAVGGYGYVSSLTVYRHPSPPPLTESRPLLAPGPEEGADYPARKASAERAVLEAFGERALLVRAGLVVGPWEYVGRLPWWLLRMRDPGPVLAPGPSGRQVQYVDARDLAEWVLDAGRDRRGGAYNLVCPPGHATMGRLLEACREAAGGGADLRWTDEGHLLNSGVRPWSELPLWIPPRAGEADVYGVDVSRAVAAGARFRPVEETVADTWAWLNGPPEHRALLQQRPWLTREREALLLATAPGPA